MVQVKSKTVEILIQEAKAAQAMYQTYNQEQVDKVVDRVAKELTNAAETLAQMAHEETGLGNAEDKKTKNLFSSEIVYDSIKDKPTVGIINRDEEKGIIEIGDPMGVIAALIPTTNPTSTVIFKALLALKSRNGIVFSPHPGAVKSIIETVRLVEKAAIEAGAPQGLIQVIEEPTLEETQGMMQHEDTALILATGGGGMVKAAYSSGNPAIGVGAGNAPVLIEKTADIGQAVERIIDSKTFDYGMICSSEEAILVEASVKEELVQKLKEKGAYFIDEAEQDKLSQVLLNEKGILNPQVVGKPVSVLAKLAEIDVPEDAKLLIAEQTNISKENPFASEKLTSLLTLYTVNDWTEGVEKASQLLDITGIGHTAIVHSTDQEKIEEFGIAVNASRIIVNSGGTLGGIGMTTQLDPSMTLGCGTAGGGSTTDNITVEHLLNIRRVATHYER
ncbi:aldehyde dehydrogenase family protein [Virgibacillus kimchii]